MITEATTQKQLFKAFFAVLMQDIPANYFWVQPADGGAHRSLWFVPASGKFPSIPPNHHVWFGVNGNSQLRGEFERALKDQIRVSNAFYADFDVRVEPGADLSAAKAAQLVLVETLQYPPSVIIDSVGGFHCYWLFKKPQHFADNSSHALFVNAQYGWVHHLGADTSATDIARTLRVAGTDNLKPDYADRPRLVRFLKHDLNLRYDAADLMAQGLAKYDALQDGKSEARPGRRDTPVPDGTVNLEQARRYAQEALKSIFIELSGMQPGSHRTIAVHERACRLGGMVGAGILDYQEAWTSLWDAAVNNGIVAKEGRSSIETQIRNGLDYGMRDPHDLSKFIKEPSEYPRPESTPPATMPPNRTESDDNSTGHSEPPEDIADTQNPSEKSPPVGVLYRDLESERAIIALALTDPGAAIIALGRFTEAQLFYQRGHQLIWTAMLALFRKAPIEERPVIRKLQADGMLEAAGGEAYFNELAGLQVQVQSLEHYLESVETCATRRFLLTLPELLKALAADPTKSAEGLLQAAQALLAPALHRTIKYPNITYMELVNKIFDDCYESDMTDNPQGLLATGFKRLDAIIGGLAKGELTVIGARPSMGKSLFMLAMAIGHARKGVKSAFLSIEMTADTVGTRGVASETEIDSQDLRWRKLKEDDDIRTLAKLLNNSDIPLVVNENPRPDVYWIDAWMAALVAQGTQVFYIDFLQMMPARPGSKLTEKSDIVGDNVAYLKELARKHKVVMIVASQVKREVDTRREKRPILSDFADSTTVETVADVAIFLYREIVYFVSSGKPNVIEVIVRKNRNGKIGPAELWCSLEKQQIRDIESHERIDLSHFR